MTGLTPVSITEFDKAKTWFDENQAIFPDEIRMFFVRIIAAYLGLMQGAKRAKQTLQTLRQAMGLVSKSEHGRKDSAPTPEALLDRSDLDPESQEKYREIQKKRAEVIGKKREYDRDLKRLKPKEKSPQLELKLDRPFEMMFSYPTAERKDLRQKQVVDRMTEFGKDRGLHVTYDYPMRMDLQVLATKIQYQVETVTDPETGKSVRASMLDEGPEYFQITWRAVGNLVKMHVGFAIPINRIVSMIGQPEFSSSKICRIFERLADDHLPVYLVMAEQLADVGNLQGDDTSTKVLDLSENEDEESISRRVDSHFGWMSQKADGSGDKKALNISLLIGRTEDDPRSTIRFYRTHIGSVGNLLDRILETRSPKAGKLIFQGDLSSSNRARSPEVLERFEIEFAGCGFHARRPFWRYREDDMSLCYYMLKGFLKLAYLESVIDAKGRTTENVLKYRGRYGRMFWAAMKNRCEAAVTGRVPGFATYPKGITPDVWPPGTELYKACMYVINNFPELTLYLSVPELEFTNNGSERAHRIEKTMLDGSKFRKTRNGRARLDVLRTINASCTAARLDIDDYFRYTAKHATELREQPEGFTPFAVARALEKQRQSQKPTV